MIPLRSSPIAHDSDNIDIIMKIEVEVFAAVREAVGSDTITVTVADRPTAGDIIAAVGRQHPELAPLLDSCRLAVDCCYVTAKTIVPDDHPVALIPPVSGG